MPEPARTLIYSQRVRIFRIYSSIWQCEQPLVKRQRKMLMEQFLLMVSINKEGEVYGNWWKELERFVITIKRRKRSQRWVNQLTIVNHVCSFTVSRLLYFDYSTSTTYRGIKCKSLCSSRTPTCSLCAQANVSKTMETASIFNLSWHRYLV